MKGFINLIKPEGMSSAYAVGSVKRKLRVTCGHMGTLDPMASGVLPVGLEKTSRLFQYLLDKDKTYIARFKFGFTTDTLDTTGTVTESGFNIPTEKQIKSVLNNFIGEIDQIPPRYSAKCIDGKRGYQLARQGVDFTLQAKVVTILDVQCLCQTDEDEFEFKIDCKGGTYIRSLARDIAKAFGTKGVMSKLTRTASGVFCMENGVTVQDFMDSDMPQQYIIPADTAVNFPKINLSAHRAQKILDGVYEDYGYADGTYRVYNENEFWGVGVSEQGKLKIKAYVR